jgi:hypothetical protein
MHRYDYIFGISTKDGEELTQEEHLALMDLARVYKVNVERVAKNVQVKHVVIAEMASHEIF